jgi:nucleoside 2-deoxyribosyltransferase
MSSSKIKYDFYLAGPFFNEEQISVMDKAKAILLVNGCSVADPRELGPVIISTPEEKKTVEFFRKIFDGNIEAMNNSAFILACLDFKDTGTAFEIGYFFAIKRPILTFSFLGGKTNVMLSQSALHHFASAKELQDFLAAPPNPFAQFLDSPISSFESSRKTGSLAETDE